MRAKVKKIISILLFTVFLSLSFVIPLATAQLIKAGYTSKTIFFLPFFIAQKKGFYNAEDLKVEIIYMGAPAVNLQALVAGQIHFSAINPDGIIIFNERGGNLKAIAGVVNGVAYTLIGGKAYKKIGDLKDAKLGVASFRGGPTTFLLEYLRVKGFVYPRDFTLVQIAGGTPVRLAALESGAVAAAVLDITNSEIAIDRGLNKLGDVSEVIPKFQFTTINIDPAWAMKNRTTVVKFLKAHIRSLRWIYENPGEAADVYAKEMGAKQPYARRGIDYFIKNRLFPIDGAITMEGMKVNIEIQAKEGLISGQMPPPEKYVDLSYLKEAQKELGY